MRTAIRYCTATLRSVIRTGKRIQRIGRYAEKPTKRRQKVPNPAANREKFATILSSACVYTHIAHPQAATANKTATPSSIRSITVGYTRILGNSFVE